MAKGAYPNIKDDHQRTALIWASEKGHIKCAATLIAKNADVNAQCSVGSTALLRAALCGHTKIVDLLLANKADVNQGFPIIAAAEQGQAETVSFLLAKNPDVNAQDAHGATALMSAAKDGRPEIARLLWAHKANISLKDRGGNTALACAVESPSFSEPTVRGLLCLSPDISGISEHCTAQSRSVFKEHTEGLEQLMRTYNEKVEAGKIQGKRIEDVTFAQQDIVQIIQTLFKDELSFLFDQENLVANKKGECLFNLYFNPLDGLTSLMRKKL